MKWNKSESYQTDWNASERDSARIDEIVRNLNESAFEALGYMRSQNITQYFITLKILAWEIACKIPVDEDRDKITEELNKVMNSEPFIDEDERISKLEEIHQQLLYHKQFTIGLGTTVEKTDTISEIMTQFGLDK